MPVFSAYLLTVAYYALCSSFGNHHASAFSPNAILSIPTSSPSKILLRSTPRARTKIHANTVYSPLFTDVVNDNENNPTKNGDKTVVVAGATGYIGRAVVEQSVKRGYKTIALVRSIEKIVSEEGQRLYSKSFDGAEVAEVDVKDVDSIVNYLSKSEGNIDTIISCLASPVGTKKEAFAIDYQAALNCLNAGRDDKVQARHYVLLSAFCCQKPLLQLQKAKLKMEAELAKQDELTWSVVRPTAFFKSVSGQLEGIQNGNPYVLFDDGAVTRCNPIAESELADFMLNTMDNEEKWSKIMNVGGPDEPLTNKMLGDMMHEAAGLTEQKYVYAPTWIFDSIISIFQVLATLTKNEFLEDCEEYARIGKYYAVEDMLTTDPEEKYGTITMRDHYIKIANEGQDPFTPIRATSFIGNAIEALPLIGAIGIPATFIATRPELASAQGSNLPFIAALPSTFLQYI